MLRFVTALALIVRACGRELSRSGRKSEEPKLKSIPRPAHRRELAWLGALNARRRAAAYLRSTAEIITSRTRVYAARRAAYHGESPSRLIVAARLAKKYECAAPLLLLSSREVAWKHLGRNLKSVRDFFHGGRRATWWLTYSLVTTVHYPVRKDECQWLLKKR